MIEIDLLHYLGAVKLLLGILGGACAVMLCIIGWAIYVTRWKTTVDIEIKALKDKKPVSEKDCIANRENCEKHIATEFGHGSAKFKEIKEALEKVRTEMRVDMQTMEERLSDTIKTLLGKNGGT